MIILLPPSISESCAKVLQLVNSVLEKTYALVERNTVTGDVSHAKVAVSIKSFSASGYELSKLMIFVTKKACAKMAASTALWEFTLNSNSVSKCNGSGAKVVTLFIRKGIRFTRMLWRQFRDNSASLGQLVG